jgi:WD40 repeat protein
VFDAAAYKEKASLRGHARSVYAVAISPEGALLATASADNTIKIRSLRTLLSRTPE